MSTDLERLVVQLEARMTSYDRAMNKAMGKTNQTARSIERRFGQMSNRMDRHFITMARSVSGFAGALGVAFGGAQFARLIGDSLEAAESINDMGRRAGVSAEFLQELRYAADQNGASFSDFDDAISRLNRRLGLFLTDGGGPAAAAFRALGLETRISSGELRDAESVFNAAVVALESMENAAQRSAIASQLFGEDSGPRLAQMLALGTEGLEEFREAARESGRVLSGELVAKGAEANATIRAMRGELATAAQSEILEYTDQLIALSEALGEIAKWGIQAAAALGGVLQLGGFISDNLRPAVTPEGAREQANEAQRLSSFVGLVPAAARGEEVQDFLGRDFTNDAWQRASRQASEEGLTFRARNERAREIQTEIIADELERLARTLSERADRLASSGGSGGGGGGGGLAGDTPSGSNAPISVGASVRRGAEETDEKRKADRVAAAELAETQAEQYADALERRRDQFSSEFARTIAGGWMAAFDGNLADFAAQRLRDALYDRLFTLFNELGRQLFEGMNGGGGGGGFLASLGSAVFGGGRANGGPVRAGMAYRVGERGPETIIPAQSGMVIPAQTPLRPQAARPQIIQQFHLHAEGAVMTDELLSNMDAKAQGAAAMAIKASRSDLQNLQKRQSMALRR